MYNKHLDIPTEIPEGSRRESHEEKLKRQEIEKTERTKQIQLEESFETLDNKDYKNEPVPDLESVVDADWQRNPETAVILEVPGVATVRTPKDLAELRAANNK